MKEAVLKIEVSIRNQTTGFQRFKTYYKTIRLRDKEEIININRSDWEQSYE